MTGTPPPLRVCLIGELRVEQSNTAVHGVQLGSRKGRTVLAVLAADPDRTFAADEIADVLWPEGPPARADAIVASLVSRLRRMFGADTIRGGRSGYRLGPAIEVDLAVAERLVGEAERRDPVEQPALASAVGRAALSVLDAGTVFPGQPDAAWVLLVRSRHAALLRRARHVVVRADLQTGDHAGARQVAGGALADDPLDEAAGRGLMAALSAAGETAAALTVYERLRQDLATQLGADPAAETQQAHIAVLRGDAATPLSRGDAPVARSRGRVQQPRPTLLGLAGRADELAELQQAWADATAARGGLVLLTGLPGAGKTRLAEELAAIVRTTGGAVLSARCYEAERGLFLQPFVEAIGAAAGSWPTATIRAAAIEHLDSLARLVPEIRTVIGEPSGAPGRPDVERRRTVEAVSGFLCALAAARPLLLVLDDLHNAGESSVELLHYLRTRLPRTPLLVVGTVRSVEGADTRAALSRTARQLPVGTLSAAAVQTLAAAAGQAHLAAQIAARTGGHALFVVEILRGLPHGTRLPASLHDAVLEQVAVLRDGAAVVRAGAVLGAAFDPLLAADVAGVAHPAALRECEQAMLAGLLVPAGRHYEFSNDVLREVIYESSPAPTLLALHARAADLLRDRPEQLASHARTLGDLPRAARAWLLAAEQAIARYAAVDAIGLASQAVDAAQRAAAGGGGAADAANTADVHARSLVARGRARYMVGRYADAWNDLGAAIDIARSAGDRRVEMVALRERAHDVHVSLGLAPADTEKPLRECLAIAQSLGDRASETDVLGRLAVLATNRLDFVGARELADQALRVGRSAGQRRALIYGLDAVKTPHVYLGEVDQVARIVAELEPLERADGDLLLLQWTVFESFVVPLAAQNYPAAIARVEAALALNRRSGYTAFEPFFTAHLAWVHRLAGQLGTAASIGAQAVAAARDHPHAWWLSTAAATHATTLIALDRTAEAAQLMERSIASVELPGTESYLLRCLAALAAASGSSEVLEAADAQLARIAAPPHSAWLLGADAYLGIARARQARGEVAHARDVLTPFRVAARRAGWPALVRHADAIVAP